jgi:hypothetical protein
MLSKVIPKIENTKLPVLHFKQGVRERTGREQGVLQVL